MLICHVYIFGKVYVKVFGLFFKDLVVLFLLLHFKGNGNPLQYSCLENPMDRGAW